MLYKNTKEFALQLDANDELQHYKDEFNKEYTKSGDLIVNTYSREDAKKYGFVQGKNNSWIFLVVLVLALGGWFWFKKHKKKKHH